MDDIYIHICSFLDDLSVLTFLSTNNHSNKLKNKVFYSGGVFINKINRLWYFDRFTNIITKKICRFPKNITYLTFGHDFNQPLLDIIPSSVTASAIRLGIPSNITHLTFGKRFNQSITGAIPASIIYLTFGYDFNQPILDAIPPNVTASTIRLGIPPNVTASAIRLGIPPNVTHLTFGDSFDQPILDALPSSITHLTFGSHFNQPILDAIPPNATASAIRLGIPLT
jgi:hypothetical protein